MRTSSSRDFWTALLAAAALPLAATASAQPSEASAATESATAGVDAAADEATTSAPATTDPAPSTDDRPVPPPSQLGAQYPKLGRDVETNDTDADPDEAWNAWDHVKGSRHQPGFLFRFGFGFGYGLASGDGASGTGIDGIDYGGGTWGLTLSLGAKVTTDFALHFDFHQPWMFSPGVDVESRTLTEDDVDAGIRLPMFGIGATGYFMPHNIFLSGTLGLGQVVYDADRGDSEASTVGPAASVMVGKAWWFGPPWGLALAGQALAVIASDDDFFGDVNGLAFQLLFLVTHD